MLCRCVFESAVSGELITRLTAYPKMASVLDQLPPKLLSTHGDAPAVPVVTEAESLETTPGDEK